MYRAHIIVVDNGSTDHTKAIIDESKRNMPSHCSMVYLCFQTNIGTTKSRNAALKMVPTGIPFVCILDSDTIVNELAISILINTLEQHTDYGLIGPKMVTSNGYIQMSGRNFPTLPTKIMKGIPLHSIQRRAEKYEMPAVQQDGNLYAVDYLMSACWLFRSALLNEVGYLDESIFYAPEDAEYCIRVWEKGYKVAFCSEATIVHEWQRLSKKKLFSRHNWEHIKGLLHTFRKHRFLFTANQLRRRLGITI